MKGYFSGGSIFERIGIRYSEKGQECFEDFIRDVVGPLSFSFL